MSAVAFGTGARITAAPSQFVAKHLHAVMQVRDSLLFEQLSKLNRAHVVMLHDTKIVDEDTSSAILKALVELDAAGLDGLSDDFVAGELIAHVEHYVTERAGIARAGNLHIGRSRADVFPTVYRLYVRERLLQLAGSILALRATVLEIARQHTRTIMPSYTHFQQAQFVTFGHYLTGILGAFERDTSRVLAAFDRTNVGTLGAGVGVGTTWPLDRRQSADLLGCGEIVESAYDASYYQDYMIEAVAACATVTANHLVLLSDLYSWSTEEFGFVDIGQEFCLSSSIMPQKRNPIGFEIIRSTSSAVYGGLVELLTTQKCENIMERCIFGFVPTRRALQTCIEMLDFEAAVIATLEVHAERMLEVADSSFAGASELANALVRTASVSFREAYNVVGVLVRLAVERKLLPRQVTPELLAEASLQALGRAIWVTADTIRQGLSPAGILAQLKTEGASNPAMTPAMLDRIQQRIADDAGRFAARQEQLERADRMLRARVEQILAPSGGGDA